VAVPVAWRSERQQGDDGAGGGCDQLLGGFVLVVGEVQGADHGGQAASRRMLDLDWPE
jgi:hypothetical protein